MTVMCSHPVLRHFEVQCIHSFYNHALPIEVLYILVYTSCIHRPCSIQAILTVGGHQYNI